VLVLFDQDNRRPDRIDEHQENSGDTSQPIDIPGDPTRHIHHDASTGCIEYQACPEEDQMQTLQSACQAFAPYSNLVADQCQGD